MTDLSGRRKAWDIRQKTEDGKQIGDIMLKIASPRQMQEIDRKASAEYGIAGLKLMENAACAVVEHVSNTIGGLGGKKVLIAAGKGNNGGDAFTAARLMSGRGAFICVYMAVPESEITGDALANFKRLKDCGNTDIYLIYRPADIEDRCGSTNNYRSSCIKKCITHGIDINAACSTGFTGCLGSDLKQSDVVIDGLFGTGFRGEAEGTYAYIIDTINKSGKTIISIDIPSGVDGAAGRISRSHIKASSTVTFALLKTGSVLHPGCSCTGSIEITDIGIPHDIIAKAGINVYAADTASAGRMLPGRYNDSNKGDYGRILIITGSTGMTGAGCLAGKAALRAGAGLVYLGVPASLSHIYECVSAETITIPMNDGGSGYFCPGESMFDQIGNLAAEMDIVAVGPGMSQNAGITDIIRFMAGREERMPCGKPLIIDADALNSISDDVRKHGWPTGSDRTGPVLITPHPGEMSRLTGLSIDKIQDDRVGTARRYAAEWNVTVLLKGYRTVIASPDGRIFINMTGNPGMASAGSGDVLTGIIAALAGQYIREPGMIYNGRGTPAENPEGISKARSAGNAGNTDDNAASSRISGLPGNPAYDQQITEPLLKAAVVGAYLHGMAGDAAAVKLGYHGMIAGDIINELPGAFIKAAFGCRAPGGG